MKNEYAETSFLANGECILKKRMLKKNIYIYTFFLLNIGFSFTLKSVILIVLNKQKKELVRVSNS